MAYIMLTLDRFYFLLPTSPCVLPHRRFFKHRPDALWFRSHRIMQCTGLLCAIVGWSIALSQFEGNIWSHRILTSCGKCIWLDSDSTCVCVRVCVCDSVSARGWFRYWVSSWGVRHVRNEPRDNSGLRDHTICVPYPTLARGLA